jgi:hypothetical protein
VTPELKERLDEAASRSGRSQSQEAEFLLERSFDRGSLLTEVLALAYGPRLGGLLMALGIAMTAAARVPYQSRADDDWTEQPDRFDHVVQAAIAILEAARPIGEIPVYKLGEMDRGEFIGSGVIDVFRGKDSELASSEHVQNALRLLGPIAQRLDADKPKEPRNPYLLAMAVIAASDDLTIWSKNQGLPLPAEPIISILENRLKQFLRNGWDRRKLESELGDEGQHSPTGQEELAAQIRRRA